MDTQAYCTIIEQVLTEYAQIPYAHKNIKAVTLFDKEQQRYMVLTTGWEQGRYVHYCLLHLDLMNNKIWIQKDNTETGIADDLERAGIPKQHIVLGFREPELRPYTGYAAS